MKGHWGLHDVGALWYHSLFQPSRLDQTHEALTSAMLLVCFLALPLTVGVVWRGEPFGYWLLAATLLVSISLNLWRLFALDCTFHF